jgi:hypothetical protein
VTERILKVSALRSIIREAMGAVKMLDALELRLIMRSDMKIEEIVTGIRIIKGVATVSQLSAVKYTPNGRRILDVLITFDSVGHETLEYVDKLARLVKEINDVQTVVVHSLNGLAVHDETGTKKLVY